MNKYIRIASVLSGAALIKLIADTSGPEAIGYSLGYSLIPAGIILFCTKNGPLSPFREIAIAAIVMGVIGWGHRFRSFSEIGLNANEATVATFVSGTGIMIMFGAASLLLMQYLSRKRCDGRNSKSIHTQADIRENAK